MTAGEDADISVVDTLGPEFHGSSLFGFNVISHEGTHYHQFSQPGQTGDAFDQSRSLVRATIWMLRSSF